MQLHPSRCEVSVSKTAKRIFLGTCDRASALTLCGVIAATAAMMLATAQLPDLALACLVVAGVADLFDGVLARRLQRGAFEKEFGVQLDTTAEVVGFLAAPAVIAMQVAPASLPLLAAIHCFVIAGVVRLAHFNTLSVRGADQSTHHRGLPVTYSALVLPLLFLLRDALVARTFALLLAGTLLLLAVLYLVNIPIRKPRGIFYVLLPMLAVWLVGYWLRHFLQQPAR